MNTHSQAHRDRHINTPHINRHPKRQTEEHKHTHTHTDRQTNRQTHTGNVFFDSNHTNRHTS